MDDLRGQELFPLGSSLTFPSFQQGKGHDQSAFVFQLAPDPEWLYSQESHLI